MLLSNENAFKHILSDKLWNDLFIQQNDVNGRSGVTS